MSFFFISYSHRNQASVRELQERINSAGFLAWVDESIHAGEEWKLAIDTAIRECLAVIVAITPESVQSQYVTHEWSLGLGLSKPIIPLVMEHVPERQLHPRLADFQYIDFSGPNKQWDTLLERLDAIWDREFVSDAVKNAVLALDNPNPQQRKNAILTLERSNDPASVQQLAKAVHHTVLDVSVFAALALARKTDYEDARVIPGLERAIGATDLDPTLRREAVDALGATRTENAVPALLKALDDFSDSELRYLALDGLGYIKSPSSIGAISQVMHENDDELRRHGIVALRRIQHPSSKTILLHALKFDDLPEVRMEAAATLACMDGPAALPILEDALLQGPKTDRERLKKIIYNAEHLHKSADQALRR